MPLPIHTFLCAYTYIHGCVQLHTVSVVPFETHNTEYWILIYTGTKILKLQNLLQNMKISTKSHSLVQMI
jgi:hypothetical protein